MTDAEWQAHLEEFSEAVAQRAREKARFGWRTPSVDELLADAIARRVFEAMQARSMRLALSRDEAAKALGGVARSPRSARSATHSHGARRPTGNRRRTRAREVPRAARGWLARSSERSLPPERRVGFVVMQTDGYNSLAWALMAAAVTSGKRCVYCGSPHGLVAHHKLPRAYGGSDSLDNLEPVCRVCHPTVERAAKLAAVQRTSLSRALLQKPAHLTRPAYRSPTEQSLVRRRLVPRRLVPRRLNGL
jgi:5-methylcytosine-specific restriction endonuclease McrA